MSPTERKLLLRTAVLGAGLVALVALAEGLGGLDFAELWLQDQKVRHHQHFTGPPTDRLLHVDIDDAALERIGRFPWSRATLGRIVEALAEAGAAQIALDMLLPEPEPGAAPASADAEGRSDPDAQLADAMARAANVLLPLSLRIHEPSTAPFEQLVQRLVANPGADEPQVRALEGAGAESGLSAGAGVGADVSFFAARREAMLRRIADLLDNQNLTLEQLRTRLLPEEPPAISGSPKLRELARQYARALALRRLGLLAREPGGGLDGAIAGTDAIVPIPTLAAAAATTGFVDFLADADGVLRRVPLWVHYRGRLYPQVGLALACRMLGADLGRVRAEPGRVVLARADGPDVHIPVHAGRCGGRATHVELLMDVPWRGPTDRWLDMYGPPAGGRSSHINVTEAWQVHQIRSNLQTNAATLDDAMLWVLSRIDPARFEQYRAAPPPPDDASRSELARWCLEQLAALGYLGVEELDPAGLDAEERDLLLTIGHLRQVPLELARQRQDLARQQAALRGAVAGRAVLVGLTATGSFTDVVPTSLHRHCPGPMVHGAIFNGIMSGELWARAPAWVDVGATLLLGLAAATAVAGLSPLPATAACLGLGLAYWLGNAVLLFDMGNLLVGAAGPLCAVGLTWAGGTLHRFVAERLERTRITRRFRSYVDPALVDWVLEHPEQARLDGALRELTVLFTDLAGFTALSERMRERTVPLLNEYLGRMVPLIRRHGGYINKFLGDGIMCFFGAPRADADHATHAVVAALEMQAALADFNRWLAQRELAPVRMRAGISSGPMVVGDAGSPDASDYTVLGDAVNLGARLESANKATGTWVLLNDRAAMLAGDRFLLRPIGRLQVVGKSQGVMTYEPLCLADQADAAQRRLVDLTDTMVSAFIRAQFERCIAAAARLDVQTGPSKLAQLYRRVSEAMLRSPPAADFVGQIVLEEK